MKERAPEIEQDKQRKPRNPHWIQVDHGLKNRDKSEPDKIKKISDSMQQDDKELVQSSRQFLEDRSGGESGIYCKRILPRASETSVNPASSAQMQNNQQLKRIPPSSRASKERNHSRKRANPHKIDYKLLRLKNLDTIGERFFPVFKEGDIPGFNFDKFTAKGK